MSNSKNRYVSPCKGAYEWWVKNPNNSQTMVAEKFKLDAQNLAAWLRKNKKKRPDGFIAPISLNGKSPKQEMLKKIYHMAVKANETSNWAASQGTKLYGQKVQKNEVQYWAMKNNLPYLDEINMGVRVKVS